ncbi:MAG: glycosyltransferase [bacterium]|nr:glycosyltransferase [bacterium]
MKQAHIKKDFLKTKTSKTLIFTNMAMAIVYFLVITFWFPRNNVYLFWMVIAGEIFHLWQLLTYGYTIWETRYAARSDSSFRPSVDVFITVAGEPEDIVEQTVFAAKDMRYPKFNVYILNDGFVAKKDNWREIERLAQRLGVHCITRTIPGGAKAGNINNALHLTHSPFIVVFDADHVPHRDFLQKTMGYFVDPQMGFVQSPQFYKNQGLNNITAGAWEQQELFFGPICKGKNRLNSAFLCGTNMAIRRRALEEVGGMCETNITEDFLTSQMIHEKGWKSYYVSEVLAEGLAPEDFLSYYKQQYRWARGSLELIFKFNPLFKKGLTWAQKIQYLASSSFFLSGPVILMNAILPLIFFFTGLTPFNAPTMALAAAFLPHIFLTVAVLRRSSNFSFTYRAVSFAMAGFTIHLKALYSILRNQKVSFAVTPKKQQTGNFMNLVIPHLIYIGAVVLGIGLAIWREGLTASVMTNVSWALFNVSVFIPFIVAAAPQTRWAERRAAALAENKALFQTIKKN